jgi:acid phosphatase (class A)
MNHIRQLIWLGLFTSVLMSMSACQSLSPGQSPGTSLTKEINEIRPGILQGYLSKDEMPDSLKLIAAPPENGTAAFKLDQEIAKKYAALGNTKREQQAAIDADLSFPNATKTFNTVLDVPITEKDTPHLYMVLRRSLADAGFSTYGAKNYYQRQRPFMVNGATICTPQDEAVLREDGSYPSGHAAIGWAWALILVEVFPENSDEILQRGKQFGVSRNVCNVHWHSDVVAGRMMGSAAIARLHANDVFQVDIRASKDEAAALRASSKQALSEGVELYRPVISTP